MGRRGDRIRRRTTFSAGMILFVGGSLLAAIATSAGSLIGACAVQGVGGALVLPAALSSAKPLLPRGAAMSRTIPGALISVEAVPADARDSLARATEASAGALIGQLRGANSEVGAQLGSARDTVISKLSEAFAHSAAWSIGLGSVMVMREMKRGRSFAIARR